MEANELRIGNWVIDNEVDPQRTVYYQVEEITYKGVVYRDGSSVTMCEYLQPIPLTEEILLKCGAVKVKHNHFVIDEWIHLSFEDDNRSEPCVDVKLKSISEKKPYYATCVNSVHQLQNLYFALTGEELEIEL